MVPGGERSYQPLYGWVAIAAYLGVEKTTAQRWEKQNGLPVRRLPGRKGKVFASPEELDAWRRGAGTQILEERPRSDVLTIQVRRRTVWLAAWCAVAAVALIGGFLLLRRTQPSGIFRIDGRDLIALADGGKEAWRYTFPDGIQSQPMTEGLGYWFGTLGGRSRRTLFPYHPLTQEVAGTDVYCFSSSGRMEWRFRPGRLVSDLRQSYSNVFWVSRLLTVNTEDPKRARVIVTAHHSWGYPNQVVALDSQGEIQGEYWHSGHLLDLAVTDVDGDGQDEVLLTGVDNGRRRATMVVLDPYRLSGTLQEPPGDSHQLRGFAPGREKAIVNFGRTCLSQYAEFNLAASIQVVGPAIQVMVRELARPEAGYVVYQFDRNLRVTGVTLSDGYKSEHRRLEAEGKVNHRVEDREADDLGKQVTVEWRKN